MANELRPSSRFIVYALHHPTSPCMYIGKTVAGMRRAVSHLHASVLAKSAHVPKSKWVTALRADGHEPEISVLEECATADRLAEAEKFYVAQFAALGFGLLNNKGKFPRKQTFVAVAGVEPRRRGTPEERREYFRLQRLRWRTENREQARAANRAWRIRNIGKARKQSIAACKRYLAKPDKKEMTRQHLKEYGAKNRDKISARAKEWVKKNPDKARSHGAKHDQTHREERRLTARKRRRENSVHVRLIESRYRKKNIDALRKRQRARSAAPGVYSTSMVLMRVKLFGDACAYCGGPFEHLDHAIALARGGSNWPANFRPACKACNLSKGAKDWRKWTVKF